MLQILFVLWICAARSEEKTIRENKTCKQFPTNHRQRACNNSCCVFLHPALLLRVCVSWVFSFLASSWCQRENHGFQEMTNYLLEDKNKGRSSSREGLLDWMQVLFFRREKQARIFVFLSGTFVLLWGLVQLCIHITTSERRGLKECQHSANWHSSHCISLAISSGKQQFWTCIQISFSHRMKLVLEVSAATVRFCNNHFLPHRRNRAFDDDILLY